MTLRTPTRRAKETQEDDEDKMIHLDMQTIVENRDICIE